MFKWFVVLWLAVLTGIGARVVWFDEVGIFVGQLMGGVIFVSVAVLVYLLIGRVRDYFAALPVIPPLDRFVLVMGLDTSHMWHGLDVAQLARVSSAAVYVHTSRLYDLGMVERFEFPEDLTVSGHQRVRWRLTESGVLYARQLRDLHREHLDAFFADVGDYQRRMRFPYNNIFAEVGHG